MSAFKDMDLAYRNAKRLSYDSNSKLVLMSDCHRGDGSGADNFRMNQNIYNVALRFYYNQGYTYIELGDGDEMWANSAFPSITRVNGKSFDLLSQLYMEERLHFIYGNHDMVKRNKKWVKKYLTEYQSEYSGRQFPLFPGVNVNESILLEHRGTHQRIFLAHGHQVDRLNNQYWKMSRFLVRHLWRPFEIIGLKNPGSPANSYGRKNEVEELLRQWSKERKQLLIAGHTHRTVFPQVGEPAYFNDGCCVYPHFITAIEIVKNKIALVKWNVKARDDGVLFVDREVLKGPTKLEDYFSGL